MSQPNPPVTAADICRRFEPGDEARKELQPGMAPLQFLEVCAAKQLHIDGLQFIAHYLPKRQAVWWGLACVRQTAGEKPREEAVEAMRATERWIAEPNEENRKATLPAADAADTGTALGCIALSAYYADGLPASPDAKVTEKANAMTAKLVAGGVLLAGVDDENPQERYAGFFSRGMEIVRRTHGQ